MEIVNGQPALASIQFLTGSRAGNTYQITKPTTTLGREPANDIVLSDPSVSRHHAQITLNHGTWTITKLTQQNTVTVNQRDVRQSAINDRDAIGLGGTSFLFLTNVRSSRAPQANKVAPAPASFIPQQPLQGAPPPPSFGAQQPVPFNPTVAAPPPLPGQNKATPSGTEPARAGGFDASRDVPSLEVKSNTHPEKTPYPLNKQVINIGRHPSNDIVINETVVSAYHAQIVREGNQLIFIHPNPQQPRTTNGLLYQGRLIAGNEPFRKPLERGDIFRIGDEHGTLVTLTYNDGSTAVQDIVPAIRPIPLGAPQISIGRHPDNMVVLNHPQVSAHHARLQLVQGGYRIVDAGSTNGVYVNALRVTNQMLKPADEVRIGPFKLTYTGTQLTQQDESNSVRIDAVHLKKFGNKQVVLLNDISIAIPPRKFVALVGGSGTGKSMLMGALNGLRPAQSGMVFYNGQDYYNHLAAFSTQLGYVPQDDIIHRDLPVERALYYAARLRLPGDFTQAQIQQRINEVLQDVDMTHRRHLMVSKLSGGQRKRVSIALELLANPSVFFLDEPTSGLDPGLDRKMMFLLRRLADKGHTIVLVTHATNNINTCDYVCFLAQGGRLTYFGPPDDAKKYFDKTDFAEIYSALEPTEQNPNIPAEAEARFRASPYYRQYVQEPLAQGPAGRANVIETTAALKQPRRGNPWKQFILLSMRYIELLKNDRGNLMILLLQAPVIALILFFLTAPDAFFHTNIVNCPPNAQIPQTVPGKFDCQNVVNALKTPQGQASAAQRHLTLDQALQKSFNPLNSGANAQKILFIMAFAAVMFGCINGAREIVKEEPIYRRERTVNLGIMPYMFSKVVVLGVLCLLQSAVLVTIVALRAPFDHSTFLPPMVEMYISLALTSLAGLMLGLVLSALAPNNDRATSFIPIILIPQVIFSGIIFQLNSPLLQILGAFFASRWSMAALGSSVGLHGDLLGNDKDFAYQGTLFTKVYPTAADQAAATAHLLLVWFALVVMIVVLAAATAYFLKRKDVR